MNVRIKAYLLCLVLISAHSHMFAIDTAVGRNSTGGYFGDDGPGILALLNNPIGVWAYPHKNSVLISDRENNRIRIVDTSGIISTVVGTGENGSGGDGGPATAAELRPFGICGDSIGHIYLVGNPSAKLRKVNSSTSIITTFAGTGRYSGNATDANGDGGPATSAAFSYGAYCTVDQDGAVYFSTANDYKVRRVSHSTSIITTVAGRGVYGSTGDGGLATTATLKLPYSVYVHASSRLFITEYNGYRVRMVDLGTRTITTFAGTGANGVTGDGGPATSARIAGVPFVTGDTQGNLFVASSNRVRMVGGGGDGIITTVAGTGHAGYSGDGGPPTAAMLSDLKQLHADASGRIYIPEAGNNVVRVLTDVMPTAQPTAAPTYLRTVAPSSRATSHTPTSVRTMPVVTPVPTLQPTTVSPSTQPHTQPHTAYPSTAVPSHTPSPPPLMTGSPSRAPSPVVSAQPATRAPSVHPTTIPSIPPTGAPTVSPSVPVANPSSTPTGAPSHMTELTMEPTTLPPPTTTTPSPVPTTPQATQSPSSSAYPPDLVLHFDLTFALHNVSGPRPLSSAAQYAVRVSVAEIMLLKVEALSAASESQQSVVVTKDSNVAAVAFHVSVASDSYFQMTNGGGDLSDSVANFNPEQVYTELTARLTAAVVDSNALVQSIRTHAVVYSATEIRSASHAAAIISTYTVTDGVDNTDTRGSGGDSGYAEFRRLSPMLAIVFGSFILLCLCLVCVCVHVERSVRATLWRDSSASYGGNIRLGSSLDRSIRRASSSSQQQIGVQRDSVQHNSVQRDSSAMSSGMGGTSTAGGSSFYQMWVAERDSLQQAQQEQEQQQQRWEGANRDGALGTSGRLSWRYSDEIL